MYGDKISGFSFELSKAIATILGSQNIEFYVSSSGIWWLIEDLKSWNSALDAALWCITSTDKRRNDWIEFISVLEDQYWIVIHKDDYTKSNINSFILAISFVSLAFTWLFYVSYKHSKMNNVPFYHAIIAEFCEILWQRFWSKLDIMAWRSSFYSLFLLAALLWLISYWSQNTIDSINDIEKAGWTIATKSNTAVEETLNNNHIPFIRFK